MTSQKKVSVSTPRRQRRSIQSRNGGGYVTLKVGSPPCSMSTKSRKTDKKKNGNNEKTSHNSTNKSSTRRAAR
jgi:hypothetical protein